MSQGWRLVNQKELYNITKDPGQTKSVAGQHLIKLPKCRHFTINGGRNLNRLLRKPRSYRVGHKEHPVVSLTSHDWIGGPTPWNQGHNRSKYPLKKRKKFQA